MFKRIVMCCDGTWNTPDQTDKGVISPSNVSKTALSLAPVGRDGVQQILFYDSGVGTQWYDKILGGLSGVGISKNILQAYRFLMEHYTQGDQLYFFGFSRGAYTVRSVMGLLRNSGLLRPENSHMISDAYALYRRRDAASHPSAVESELFRRVHSRAVGVKFVGVWDTVGALGIPARHMHSVNKLLDVEFHDVDLSSSVENAFQALAIDERRGSFEPCLWNLRDGASRQRLEQTWFSGSHSNIGGGYCDTGLSDITFTWMCQRAEECDLTLDTSSLERLRFPLRPAWNGELRDSKSAFFKLFPDYVRPITSTPNNRATISPEAWQRYDADPAYRHWCSNLAHCEKNRTHTPAHP